jgi:outer membrane protein OmpA-like peptidoglycan-associated protein
VATPLADVAATGGGLPKWLLPLLGIVLLGLLLWWLLKSCNTDKTAATTANTETMVVPADSTLNANIGTDSGSVVGKGAAAGAMVAAQVEDFSSVVLFFENDQPNKNSTAITTTASYTETFEKYMSAKNTFVNQQDSEEQKKAIAAFFTDDVKKGYQDLKELTGKIAEALENGKKVEVKVKGFASPLAANDYNTNLTKRRIASILNYFKKFESGRVAKYIGNVAITEEPNGEGSAPAGISDDKVNVKNSVYNLSASKERRVEILDVRIK